MCRSWGDQRLNWWRRAVLYCSSRSTVRSFFSWCTKCFQFQGRPVHLWSSTMLLVELCICLFIEPHLLSLHCDLLIFSYLNFWYFRNNFKSLSDHVYKQMIACLPLNLNTTTTNNNNTTMGKKNIWHIALAASNSTLLVGKAFWNYMLHLHTQIDTTNALQTL